MPWWRHQMETFSALLALCAGNSSVTGEFPSQRPVARSFDIFFDMRLNKRLSKQSIRRWFETPSRSCDVTVMLHIAMIRVIYLHTHTHIYIYHSGSLHWRQSNLMIVSKSKSKYSFHTSSTEQYSTCSKTKHLFNHGADRRSFCGIPSLSKGRHHVYIYIYI